MASRLDQLESLLAKAQQDANGLPPVESWQPELSGDIDIRICSDGRWLHEGGEFQRLALVRLFSSILRHEQGVLLLAEKVVHEDGELTALEQEFHHRFKREMGYSDLEISQKRDALERVLIPESLEQHQRRLQRVGFRQIDIWFKWFNFAALLCRREGA